jgi:hypothetical protein
MRTRTLSLAAIVALGVSPAMANDYVGTFELGAGYIIDVNDKNNNTSLDDDSFPLIEGVARGNIPLAENFALQLDAGGLATFGQRSGGEDYLQTVFFGAAHLTYRTEEFALGALAQLGSANGGEDENANFYNFGGEGLYNLSDFTLIAQGGYFWANDENQNDVMTDAWWVRGVARFYAGADTRIQGEFSYADGEERNSGGDEVTAMTWGGRIDHSFGGPVAVFVGYKGTNIENVDLSPEEITEHTVTLGLNLRFGADSIKSADRNGPSFDTPDVGRWTGWTTGTVN